MNWFGATGFVTAAKSTLKGAQKAIDKALDIKEEDDNENKASSPGGLLICLNISLTSFIVLISTLVSFRLTLFAITSSRKGRI